MARAVAWCEDGPPGAHVADVQVEREDPTGETSFRVRSTEYGAR